MSRFTDYEEREAPTRKDYAIDAVVFAGVAALVGLLVFACMGA